MTIQHVQDAANQNTNSSSVAITGITTTAGNDLFPGITLTDQTLAFESINLTSITDSAGNVWRFSTLTASQNPPANQSSSGSIRGYAAMACCLNSDQPGGTVKAITSVTVNWNRTTSAYNAIALSEFSGIPADAVLVSAASTGAFADEIASASQPLVVPAVDAVVVGCFEFNGNWAVSPPFTGYDLSYVGLGWLIPPSPGSYDLTWTTAPSGSDEFFSSAVLAVGTRVPSVPAATVAVGAQAVAEIPAGSLVESYCDGAGHARALVPWVSLLWARRPAPYPLAPFGRPRVCSRAQRQGR